jgi:hypothetical protein
MPRDVLVIWNEGEWRCEVHTNGIPGEGHFLVYRGDHVVTAEAVHMGTAAYTRAEILRQRVLRGDLRDNYRHLLDPPSR